MDLVPLLAILMTFGMPMYIVRKVVEARTERHRRELEAKQGGSGGAGAKELADLRAERKLLVERIENLETIVCGVDFELNQKMTKLLDEQRSLLQARGDSPPALGVGASPSDRAGTSGVATAATNPAGPRERPATTPPGARGGPDAVAHTMTAIGKAPVKATNGEIRPGDVLANRYRVQRLLGRGGMGAVYLCDDEVLGELVALKMISSAWASDEAALIERFKREAQAARKVSSANVIRIHDLGEARPGLLYLSMEYFPGRTLSEVIAQRGLVPINDCRDYLSQICEGLAAAHDAGVIHRDLKPQNVLVGERSSVKLIDFGLAKATAAEGLTASGMLMGTPHYMAPEQIRGRAVDIRTDVYALGALAFHLIVGRPPFSGENAIAVGFGHLSETPPALRTLRPEAPAGWEQAVAQALEKEPARRPTDARRFRELLK